MVHPCEYPRVALADFFFFFLTIRMDPNGRSVMYEQLHDVHFHGIVCHFLDFLSWPLSWQCSKVLLSKSMDRTLLTQNSKNIGKTLSLPQSMCNNSHTQLLSGKLGSLKNMSTNLSAQVSIRFASLYVDLSPYYNRIRINDTIIQLGYWIVENLVNRDTEFYPKGGMSQLVSFPYSDNRQVHRQLATFSKEVWANWKRLGLQSFSTTTLFLV